MFRDDSQETINIQMSNLQRLPAKTLRRYLDPSVCSACSRRSYSKKIFQGTLSTNFALPSSNVLAENDIVLLKHKTNSAAVPVLTNRLHAGNKIELVRDSIFHDAILGKGVRDLISTRKRASYRLLEPTLAEYTDLSPRIVTPVSYGESTFEMQNSDGTTVDLLPRREFDRLPPRPPSNRPRLQ